MSETPQLPHSGSLPFIEGLYTDFRRDPASVSDEWRKYFQGFENGEPTPAAARTGPSFRRFSLFNPPTERVPQSEAARLEVLQDRVDQLVRSYRFRGHMIARINPLGIPRSYPPELDPKHYGFALADMERVFSCETLHPQGPLTLAEILDRLWNTYCRSIGVEYMHIDEAAVRQWLQERMERTQNRLQLSRKEQLRIYTRLTDATIFEQFIRKKFVGAKSFSLEGSESLIPLLDLAIEKAGEQGVEEIVFGMAHRGRLNVLANIMGKSPRQIFREFADSDPKLFVGGGDVKYHLGHSSDWKSAQGKKLHLSLCFNPSHLEFVNPLVLGRVRSKQDRLGDQQRKRALAILIHGDASFAGQGVVQETLNLSGLRGYTIGGTLHVLVNNQIGFTTGPDEARSTAYATDVAKMLQVPIFHVNGEDPEAVAQVVRVAMEFRENFQRDVVIDMYGYRRLGHNESDEPSFTQPLLYQAIENRKPVREGYLDHLLKLGGLARDEAEAIAAERQAHLEKELGESKAERYKHPRDDVHKLWRGYIGGVEPKEDVATGVDKARLSSLLASQTRLPENFNAHPKILRLLEARRRMAGGEQPLDWSGAEAIALASLAAEGCRIRLTGQDTARGTFTQRHAVCHDYQNGRAYMPLQHVDPKQGPVEIINSPLSEVGVMGFEYGYSLDWPDGLVLWEAQFGDFVNVAQVLIDQFISSAEDKWGLLSGLVLLLPHGFEGAGPEHSSARLERFLTLAAEDNIQVAYPTTPAQYFHLLRRQVVRRWRKPLVVMTPKSLLRHSAVVSTLEECGAGHFHTILPDSTQGMAGRSRDAGAVSRVLLCAGKVYYDLDKHRAEHGRNDVAILRLEQLYPLRVELLKSLLSSYREGTRAIWVQEEPENMGAWHYMRAKFGDNLFGRFPFSGLHRAESASPATGSAGAHKKEQDELVASAFAK